MLLNRRGRQKDVQLLSEASQVCASGLSWSLKVTGKNPVALVRIQSLLHISITQHQHCPLSSDERMSLRWREGESVSQEKGHDPLQGLACYCSSRHGNRIRQSHCLSFHLTDPFEKQQGHHLDINRCCSRVNTRWAGVSVDIGVWCWCIMFSLHPQMRASGHLTPSQEVAITMSILHSREPSI